jgi:hypothetical protein
MGTRFTVKPITFRWDRGKLDEFFGSHKKEKSPDREQQQRTGFIAQEVERAADEIGYEFSGIVEPANSESAYNLRYAEFVVPLVEAVQEEQKQIDRQEEQIQHQQKQIKKHEEMIETLTKKVEKLK